MNYIKDRYEQMDYIKSYKKLENLILYSVNVEKQLRISNCVRFLMLRFC